MKQDLKQDVYQEEEKEKEEVKPSLVLVNGGADDEGCGYQTPKSKQHKIPELIPSCSPPPPPKKRRSVFLHKRKVPKLDFFEKTTTGKEDLELFFQSFPEDFRVPPAETDLHTTAPKKKRRTDQ